MLDALLNSVLPIFAIVAIGLAFGRWGFFDRAQAAAINRFLFYVAMPALMFGLLARSDFGAFDWALLSGYLAVEGMFYAGAFALFHLGLKRSQAESAVLAMGVIFANHLMYVLPIAVAEFGPAIGPRIVAMIALDTMVFYFGNMVLLEVLTARERGISWSGVAGKIFQNPQVYAIVFGVLASILRLPLDNGLGVFTDFVGKAAAPASLFALGVVMSAEKFEGQSFVPYLLTVLKLAAVPGVALVLLVSGLGFEISRASPAILVMAGPVGAMPFVLALQYGQRTGEIARAILISTVLSVLTVSIALQLV